MQVQNLHSPEIINELSLGSADVNRALQQKRRADFALLLAMFSDDASETTPSAAIQASESDDAQLRRLLNVPQPQALRCTEESYSISANAADSFHHAGIASCHFYQYLKPEALAFMPQNTGDLPEELFNNLSAHEQRKLKSRQPNTVSDTNLYAQLVSARRHDQLNLCA